MLAELVLLSTLLFNSVAALPQVTSSPSSLGSTASITVPPSAITAAPGITCTDGSTIKVTTECTYGNTYTICYSQQPRIQCSSGYYPGSVAYGHCEVGQTCYAVDAPWITTTCPPNGETAYATSTLYQGTLADGKSTIIEQVQCACASDMYYSWPSSGTGGPYCMPRTNCGAGQYTSYSTATDCLATPAPTWCSTISLSVPYCACTSGLPQYPSSGATATTCA